MLWQWTDAKGYKLLVSDSSQSVFVSQMQTSFYENIWTVYLFSPYSRTCVWGCLVVWYDCT